MTRIALSQPGTTYEVQPLSYGESIQSFYGASGRETSTNLEESDRSMLFFYEDVDGIYLVIIHDRPGDGSGGAVTFEMQLAGEASDGAWVYQDDNGDFNGDNDNYPDWSWNDRNKDGGVFRGGLDGDFSITINALFNDDARREPLTNGRIDEWVVLDGGDRYDAESPEVKHLDMDELVDIQSTGSSEPPMAGNRTGSATVFSWVPGRNENDNLRDRADFFSAFPNEGPNPLPIPIDEGFIGDQARPPLSDTVAEALSMRKSVQGLDGEFRQYRTKHTVEVSFESEDGQTISVDEPVDIRTNVQEPDVFDFSDARSTGGTPPHEVTLLNPSDPEPLSQTIVEENIDSWMNLSIIDYDFDDRVMTAYSNERYLNVELQEFDVNGETVEGVRLGSLWGGEDAFTRDITRNLHQPHPIIFQWVDMAVLANGMRAVRVQDTSPFPMHTLYTGPAGQPERQDRRSDSGLEIIWDLDETSEKGEFEAALDEKDHTPWKQFYTLWADGATKFEPYNTPHKRYLKSYDDDTTGRWWGYRNELLLDHPVIEFGSDGDGGSLPDWRIEDLMTPAMSPFPGTEAP